MKSVKNFNVILAAFGMIIFILDVPCVMAGASEGINLCLRSLLPCLFPMMFLINIIISDAPGGGHSVLRKTEKSIGMFSGLGCFLIPSILGGYPMGGICMGQAVDQGRITIKEAEKMLPIVNNAGPAFIFGVLGPILGQKWMPWVLWLIQLFSAFLISLFFSPIDEHYPNKEDFHISVENSMKKTVQSMLLICGWVVFFRTVLAFINRWIMWMLPATLQILIGASLELTNGCTMLSQIQNTSLRFLLSSFLLPWGGLCIWMQTSSVASNISMRYYIVIKMLQGLISLIMAAGILYGMWPVELAIMVLVMISFQKIRFNSRKTHSIIV